MNQFLEAVARAVLDVFELSTPTAIKEEADAPSAGLKKRAESSAGNKTCPSLSISLIAPLVSKLPGTVQGRILKVASQVLESCNWGPPSKGAKEKERGNAGAATATLRSKSLLSYEPLLSLVMTCLKGQDEQRFAFVSSLHSQLSTYSVFIVAVVFFLAYRHLFWWYEIQISGNVHWNFHVYCLLVDIGSWYLVEHPVGGSIRYDLCLRYSSSLQSIILLLEVYPAGG